MTITVKVRWDEANFRETAEHYLEADHQPSADPEGGIVDKKFTQFHDLAMDAIRRQVLYSIEPITSATRGNIRLPLPEFFMKGYWVHSQPRYDFEPSRELKVAEREAAGFSEVTAFEIDHPAHFGLEVDVSFFIRMGQ